MEEPSVASKNAIELDSEKKQCCATQDGDEVSAPHPSGLNLAVLMVGLGFAVFCIALDNTIISTAIPKITDDFKAVNDVGWYGSAFLLTISASQPFFGRLYSTFTPKWIFLVSLLIFELGSLLCGAAPNSNTFIAGRAVSGLGASGLFSGAFVIVALVVPLATRPKYIGLISASYAISSVLGPLLGGVFADKATWRWCFYINLPIGAITALTIVFFLRLQDHGSPTRRSWKHTAMQFDPLGTVLLIPCIICLLLALQLGGSQYAWSAGRVIALFAVFAILLVAFVVVEILVGSRATIPVRVAKQRTMAFACLFTLCLSASFFIVVYYLPIWFQAIRGRSAVESGIDTLPLTISVVVGTTLGGFATTIFGYYVPLMYASSTLGAIGAGLLYTLTVETSIAKVVGYQLIFGFGIGLGLQQNIVAAQTVLGADDMAVGTAIAIFAQNFGGAVFISVAQNLFLTRILADLSLVPGIDVANITRSGATEITKITKNPTLLHTVRVAYNDSLRRTFLLAVILVTISVLGALGCEWKSVKPDFSSSTKPEPGVKATPDRAQRSNSM